jgi:AcrR family transcriptional regulator
MPEETPTKRKYNSERRQAQARETRSQIVQAARRLFIERGYAGTTIEAIAQEAGVAVETVYSAFGSKRALLSRLMGVLVRGDEEPTPLLDRPGPQSVHAERDQRKQVRLFAHDITGILQRVAPIFVVVRTASQTEPEIANILQGMLDGRLQNLTHFVEWLAENGPLRDNLAIADATDIVWTITTPEVHQLLTVDRGWSSARYEEWLAGVLTTLLLPE